MNLIEIQKETKIELGNKETMNALIETTFKGLSPLMIEKAIVEAKLRGFILKDFLEKNVYAIPFKDKKTGVVGYSLITSIDYARKIGMKNGVVGVTAPIYTETEKGEIETCTVTVKRKVDDYIGEYSATVYFKEYSTGYQQWASKPRTMIAKVAEMHALRKACPEELSQAYTEEEVIEKKEEVLIDVTSHEEKLKASKSIEELQSIWSSIPGPVKVSLLTLKDEMKKKYENA